MHKFTVRLFVALTLSACASTEIGSRRADIHDGGGPDGASAASGGFAGGKLPDAGSSGGSAGSSGVDGASGVSGASGAGGSGGATGGSSGGGAGASTCPKYPPAASSLYPGDALTDPAAIGAGDCGTTTLADTLARIVADHPELGDITTIFDPSSPFGGDGSFVYPYRPADGGFAIVFKRGSGDCPAGCTDNEYWYFETRAACAPVQVGHYHPAWVQGPNGNCLSKDGDAMWGSPPPPDPVIVCGASLAPEDIQGTHRFRACGQRVPCSDKAAPGETVDTTITVEVTQNAGDPTTGTVRITGSGNVLVDGRALPATFQKRRFAVSEEYSNLPSACPEQHTLVLRYDFEGFGERTLSLEEMATPDCGSPGVYCKGSLNLGLSSIP